MSIMEYNGSAIVAMAGKNCIAIATDKRYGIRQLQTVSCNMQVYFRVTLITPRQVNGKFY